MNRNQSASSRCICTCSRRTHRTCPQERTDWSWQCKRPPHPATARRCERTVGQEIFHRFTGFASAEIVFRIIRQHLANVEHVIVRSQNHVLDAANDDWCCTLAQHRARKTVGLLSKARCFLGRKLQHGKAIRHTSQHPVVR